MAQNPLAISDVDNEVLREADEYLRKHKILELFEDLTTILAYKQPEQLENFLIDILKQRKMNGNRSIVYSDTELQNIFALYDLKGAGFITKEQCREGKFTHQIPTNCFNCSFKNFGQLRVPLSESPRGANAR